VHQEDDVRLKQARDDFKSLTGIDVGPVAG
jgi:hypothetical protein